MDELELSGRKLGEIDAGNRLAEHRPFARRFSSGRSAERNIQPSPSNELAVTNTLRVVGFRPDDAVDSLQLGRRQAQALRSEADQVLPRGRGGLGEIALVEVGRCGLTARGGSLVRRHVRVAFDQLHTSERHRELLGDQLELRGVDPLTELALPGAGGHAAVGVHGDPRVELARIDMGHPRPEGSLGERKALDEGGGPERDDEGRGALEEDPA